MKKFYVAYGSNLHLEQMRHRCPDSKVFGRGVIKNHELTFWGHGTRGGVATILPHLGTDVPVGVFEISASDEANLDIYEGFPSLYRKENIEVELDNGKKIIGMVYIMNQGFASMPSPFYYNVIRSGYESFGFDIGFLAAAKSKVYAQRSEDDIAHESFMRLINW